jgi:hypothetical protein
LGVNLILTTLGVMALEMPVAQKDPPHSLNLGGLLDQLAVEQEKRNYRLPLLLLDAAAP